MKVELKVDPERQGYALATSTGVLVRAKREGRWDNVDIVELDAASLLAWLRSRGGHNPWAENVVGILLGHACIASENGDQHEIDT